MANDQTSLLSEIKLLLQEELADVRESVHKIEVRMTELKGDSIARSEFTQVIEAERDKRELLELRANVLDRDIHGVKASMKIYIGIAAGVAGIIGSGLGGLLFALLG